MLPYGNRRQYRIPFKATTEISTSTSVDWVLLFILQTLPDRRGAIALLWMHTVLGMRYLCCRRRFRDDSRRVVESKVRVNILLSAMVSRHQEPSRIAHHCEAQAIRHVPESLNRLHSGCSKASLNGLQGIGMTETGHPIGKTRQSVENLANPSSPMHMLHPNTISLSNDCHVYKVIQRYERREVHSSWPWLLAKHVPRNNYRGKLSAREDCLFALER